LLASRHVPDLARRGALQWLFVTVVLAAYAALMQWGPDVMTAHGLIVQVIAQKVATVVVAAAVLFIPRDVSSAPLAPSAGH
jgi:hypothetical protein